tara:strand:+ start:10615 stop:10806 length:192 start_codon:yes stop_codon:yes gene_type:complete
MNREDYAKGVAAATAAVVAGKRPKQRQEIFDRVLTKVRSQGISAEALTKAVERSEKNAARRKQ